MLRIASTLIILVGLGHLVGHMMGMDTAALPEAEKRVTDAMQGLEFEAGGWKRTYWSFFVGFSASYSVLAIALGLLGFQAARLGAGSSASLRGTLVVVTASSSTLAILCFNYLVLPPAVMLGLAALCGLVGITKGR